MITESETAKEWLVRNNYEDVRRRIERVEARWLKSGKKTRRNWWDVLAGSVGGRPSKIEGVKLPILRAARLRKNWGPAKHELCRNTDEIVPIPKAQPRWGNELRTIPQCPKN